MTTHRSHQAERVVMQMAALNDPTALRASNHLKLSRDRRLSKATKRVHRRTFERLSLDCLSRYREFAEAHGLT